MKLKLGQYFAADVWLTLRSCFLADILKLGLVMILNLNLIELLMFGSDFEVYKGARQKLLSRFCPLRGGGPPLSAKLF